MTLPFLCAGADPPVPDSQQATPVHAHTFGAWLQVGLDVDFPLLPGTPRAGVVVAPDSR